MGKFEGPRCEEEEFAVESSEETLLGFTPQDAADQMPLSNTVGLEWEDGTVDCLHYSLQLIPIQLETLSQPTCLLKVTVRYQ